MKADISEGINITGKLTNLSFADDAALSNKKNKQTNKWKNT